MITRAETRNEMEITINKHSVLEPPNQLEREETSNFMRLNYSCRYVEIKGQIYIVKEIKCGCLKTFKTWTSNGWSLFSQIRNKFGIWNELPW